MGKSTVNLWRTSLVLPQSVPNNAPLPSITMKPNLLSSSSKAVNAWIENKISQYIFKVQIQKKSFGFSQFPAGKHGWHEDQNITKDHFPERLLVQI